MSLAVYTKPVDGTIPVAALLYDDEDLLASQDGVGIYDGNQKSPPHQSGSIHITSHRLFFITSSSYPFRSQSSSASLDDSFSLDLASISQTEYYAGLFTSSAKITLHLTPQSALSPSGSAPAEAGAESNNWATWECEVCGYRNPPGLSPAKSAVCGLCGVPRSISSPSSSSSPSPAPIRNSKPSSLPTLSTASHLQTRAISTPPSPDTDAQPTSDFIECPACTFHNHPSLRVCEICSTALPPRVPQGAHAKSAPTSRAMTPAPGPPSLDADEPGMIKLSFRKGGDKNMYAVLKRSLLGKGWEVKEVIARKSGTSTPGTGSATPGVSGINQILQSIQTTSQARQTDLSSALSDLEALMNQTKKMVNLAKDLCIRWEAIEAKNAFNPYPTAATPTASSSNTTHDKESAKFIRNSLSQLGLQLPNAPVTQDMYDDERRWVEGLAVELAGVLQGSQGMNSVGGIMKRRGIVGLDEIWGGWNRARGVALIPPSTFLSVLPHLQVHTNPTLLTRSFPSGLTVLHTPPYTHKAFTARLVSLLTLSGEKTTLDIAREEEVNVGLAREMVEAVERDGEVVRDEDGGEGEGGVFGGGKEVRWWRNVFVEYAWDGQTF
ncbi:hypothetical protein JAAARDRAFT_141403 [Jaapia argillacea MUCL 33604]|uniref:Vacuolar protein-sorting-associated protein 36 n=1 Tax=Jaapia argillacea MUCL 33604 TaxID=933084 RepID=A0A067P7L7_9AGAM|nr:hypothetical protein JAAARDRAFT_141403 [Jaapia argillacea MUCL 33604]